MGKFRLTRVKKSSIEDVDQEGPSPTTSANLSQNRYSCAQKIPKLANF